MNDPVSIKFGEWLPDSPDYNNPGLAVCTNFYPSIAGGYLAALIQTAAGKTSVISHNASNYAGTAFSTFDPSLTVGADTFGRNRVYLCYYDGSAGVTKIARADFGSPITLTDLSNAAINGIAAGTKKQFQAQFARYGDKIIVVHPDIAPQIISSLTAAPFAALGGSPPNAECITVIGEQVVIGRLSTGKNRVHWSGYGDETAWTPSLATQSDYQDFPDGKDVTGLVGFQNYGYIFFSSSIHRMEYVGPPLVFKTELISDSVGMPFINSAIVVQGVVYFRGQQNRIYALFQDGTLKRISAGKTEEINLTIPTWAKYNSGIYYSTEQDSLYIPQWNGTGDYIDDVYVYQLASGRWSFIDYDRAPQCMTFFETVSSIGHTFYAIAYTGLTSNREIGIVYADATTATTCTLETGNLELFEGRQTLVTGVRVLGHAADTAYSVQIGTQNTPDDAITWSSAATINPRTGIADVRALGRYITLRVILSPGSTTKETVGAQIYASPAGRV